MFPFPFMPPRRSIEYIGSASASATSVALPTHQAGDLIVIFAIDIGSIAIPALASGYTSAVTGSDTGGSDSAARVGYKIAASSGETSGTWTDATWVSAHVYRGVNASTPIGGTAYTGYAAAGAGTITYPAITMADSSGSSLVATAAGHNDSGLTLACTGMTARQNNTVTDSNGSFDTGTGVSSWAGFASAQGGNSAWSAVSVEIRA